MIIPVISIVGRSDTGKTTLIEKLLPELAKRGYRAATIKHDVHGFEIDKEGKDSFRHKRAGARISIISSPEKIAVIKDTGKDSEIDEIAFKFIDDVDLILTEGYKKNNKPKIEVFRKEAYPDLLCSKHDNLLAIASDSKHETSVPQFDINDTAGIADFIEKKFLVKRKKPSVSLEVNGNVVPLKPFIQKMLLNSVNGMVSALKGCRKSKRIVIKVCN